jgi:hypothetical protein
MNSGATNFMIFAVLIIVLLFIYIFSNRAASTNNQTTEPPKDISGKFNPVSVKKEGPNLGNIIGDVYNYAGSLSDHKEDDNIDSPRKWNRKRNSRSNAVYDSNYAGGDYDADSGSNSVDDSKEHDEKNIETSKHRRTPNLASTPSFYGSTTFSPYSLTTPTPLRSKHQTTHHKTGGHYTTTPAPTTLTSYSNASITTTRSPYLSASLSKYKYLGDIDAAETIKTGTRKAKLQSSSFPLDLDMYIKIGEEFHKIVNINNNINARGNNLFTVKFDKPINSDVEDDERLSVYYNAENNISTTPSGEFSTTPSGEFATTPFNTYSSNFSQENTISSKNVYLLHLSRSSKINSSLVFKPYSDVTDAELKMIPSLIVHTPENFGEEITTDAPFDATFDDSVDPSFDVPTDPSFDAPVDPNFDAPTDPSFDVTNTSFYPNDIPLDVTEPPIDLTDPSLTDASFDDPTIQLDVVFDPSDASLPPDTSSLGAIMSSFATTMSSLLTTTRPDFNSCGSASKETENGSTTTAAPSSNEKLSAFYITDCLSYPIYTSVYRNGTLIVQLKTNDDRAINAGYYKLVI